MAQEWVADQVEVTVQGLWTTRHRLQAAGDVLAEFTLSAWQGGGTVRLADGRAFAIARTRWWKEEYELRVGPDVLARAGPRGFLRREIAVQFGDQEYALAPASFWSRAWQLRQRDAGVLLEIRPAGVFRRGAILTVLAELDVALLSWAYFLVHRRRQAEAAAAAA